MSLDIKAIENSLLYGFGVDYVNEANEVRTLITAYRNLETRNKELEATIETMRALVGKPIVIQPTASSTTYPPDTTVLPDADSQHLIVGRPISREDALALASRIMEDAERKRIEFAEAEAEESRYWDDD